MFIDLHVCPGTGEDNEWLEDVLAGARHAGLDAIVLTGQDEAIDPFDFEEMAENHGVRIFVAVEVPTDEGTVLLYPSAIADDFFDHAWQIEPNDGFYSYSKIRTFCEDRKWAILAAQPYQSANGMKDRIYELEGLHAVEVMTQEAEPLALDLAMEAARARRLPTVASTGNRHHKTYDIKAVTALLGTATSQSGLVDMLMNGDCWIFSAQATSQNADTRPDQKRKRTRRGGKQKSKPADQGA